MKVLMLCGSYPPARCGVGDYTRMLSRELASLGAGVVIITSSYLGTKKSAKNPEVIPIVDSWKAENTGYIFEKIREISPDIVHIQYPNLEYKKNFSTNILPWKIKCSFAKVKVVETFHEPVKDLTVFGQLRLGLNMFYADACVFVEKENYDMLPFFLKAVMRSKKSVFIPIGSNIKYEKSGKGKAQTLRKRFDIPLGKKILMTFGFITKVKGYENLLKIFRDDREAWVHLGQVNTAEVFQKKFMDTVKNAEVKINFTGHVVDRQIARYLLSADVCVFPFKEGVTDRHGTFLAAASQGVFIAAFHRSKKGYIKEENVFYARCGNLEGLRKAIDFKSPVTRIKPELIGWKEIAKRHMELYRSL